MGADPAVMVAIPCVEWTYTQAVMALLQLRLPPGSRIVHERGGSAIAAKRNRLAETFVQHKQFGALLFLDSDMTPPPETVARLLGHGLPIVGALAFTRIPPFRSTTGRDLPNGSCATLVEFGGPNPVERVDWIGTGCLLIRCRGHARTS